MPYDEDGNYYTTRIGDDLKGQDAMKRIYERGTNARRGAQVGARLGAYGGPVGSALGATLGGISGFILGDETLVFPVDMVAIPAYQAYMLAGTPAFQVYIKEGEVLTQVQPTDAQEAEEVVAAPMPKKKKQRLSKWNRYVKNKKNHIRFKSGKNKGKLDLKKMAKAGGFGKKKGGKK